MNQSLLQTKLFSGLFFSEKDVKGLPGLRSLLKGDSALFDGEKCFQNSEMGQSSMSTPPCRAHPTCFLLLPLPPLGLTSFSSWCAVSMSWLLILQDSSNVSPFICPRLVLLTGSPHFWDPPALPCQSNSPSCCSAEAQTWCLAATSKHNTQHLRSQETHTGSRADGRQAPH